MKLKEVLKTKFTCDFEFVDMAIAKDSKGEDVVTFILKNPIPVVIGSRSVSDGDDSMKLEAYDVDRIQIHSSDLGDDDGIEVNEDQKTGTVKSRVLMLDVTERGDVQARRESLAAFGQNRRNEARTARRAGIYNKMADRKTKGVYGNTSIDPVNNGEKGVENTADSQNNGKGTGEVKTPKPTSVGAK